MERADAVVAGLASFYSAFCSHDPERFAAALASGEGVSVIGSAPDEGHDDRDSWIETYARYVPELGMRLEGGPAPRGFAEGAVGFCVDQPRFVLRDGSFLPTRLTAVLREDAGAWKVVHLHFSVGVPDEDAIQPPQFAAPGG